MAPPLLLDEAGPGDGDTVSFVDPVSFFPTPTAFTAALSPFNGLLGYIVAAGGGLLGYGGTSER